MPALTAAHPLLDISPRNNKPTDMETKYYNSPSIEEILLVAEGCLAASVADYVSPFEEEVEWI